MTYKLFDKEISGLFTIPSGIVTTTSETLDLFGLTVPQLGILTTKSISLEPKEGNLECILTQVDSTSFMNAVGLSNPGAEYFAKELKNIRLLDNKFLLVSVFGSSPEEFQEVVKILESYADGFELNFSCPHAESGGAAIGSSLDDVVKFTSAVKNVTDKPIFVKLTPQVPDIGKIAEAAVKAGADGITAINTLVGDNDNLYNRVGGLSGEAIKYLARNCIRRIREKVDVPIIGMGGITSANDVREMQVRGANYFGIGTALADLDSDGVRQYFKRLEHDFFSYSDDVDKLLRHAKIDHTYRKLRIRNVEVVDEDLKIFTFDDSLRIFPGQFVFLKILNEKRRAVEKPFSPSNSSPLEVVVRKVGRFTSRFFELDEGDRVFMRGPYGRMIRNIDGFERAVLVGGGTGIAPTQFIYQHCIADVCTTFLGATTEKQLFYQDFFGRNTHIATDDGSSGFHGTVVDLLKEKMPEIVKSQISDKSLSFFNCGPAKMIHAAVEVEKEYAELGNIVSMIEMYTKCGTGLCGSCAMDNGFRACVDGPSFSAHILAESKKFPDYKRDSTGAWVKE